MAKDFYAPREIRFTRNQVLWLIKNLSTLRSGYWPTEASSYIDLPLRKKTSRRGAYFTTPVEYAAEIETRLEKCGLSGLILEALEGWDKTVASLSVTFRVSEWVIQRRRRQALAFVAGWRRKVK